MAVFEHIIVVPPLKCCLWPESPRIDLQDFESQNNRESFCCKMPSKVTPESALEIFVTRLDWKVYRRMIGNFSSRSSI